MGQHPIQLIVTQLQFNILANAVSLIIMSMILYLVGKPKLGHLACKQTKRWTVELGDSRLFRSRAGCKQLVQKVIAPPDRDFRDFRLHGLASSPLC